MNSSELELDVSAGATDARVIKNVRPFPALPLSERAHRVPKPEKETAAMESLCTFSEAAKVLGISLRQFRRLVGGGKIAFVKSANGRRPADGVCLLHVSEYVRQPDVLVAPCAN